jgi:uncharacterized lipoprotein YajG
MKLAFLLLPLLLAGCSTTSRIVTGTPRAPILASDVRIYTAMPHGAEQVAILNADGRGLALTKQARMDMILDRLKVQAANLGANGIVLTDVSQPPPSRVGSAIVTHTPDVTSVAVFVPKSQP